MQACHIVLLGAGHAHLAVLRRFAMRPDPAIRLTLIAREPETPYSGMLPGLIRGDYTSRQAHIDLAPISVAAGARLIMAAATAIDLNGRSVAMQGRPPIGFDLLSINVGGEPRVPAGGIGVKPIGRFLDRLHALEATLPDNARIAIVGGGAAGTELALALAVRFRGRLRLVLVSASPEPVPFAPAAARRAIRQALVEAGIELASGVSASGLRDGRLSLSDGSFLDVAAALWATGVEGPDILAESGLACDPAGCVRINRTLRCVSHNFVFAAGDCTALEGDPRPKAGVWAVRTGITLAENLRRSAHGIALKRWRPRRDALSILGLGDGRAVGWRNGVAIEGRAMGWLKDRIDRRWMRAYNNMRIAPDADNSMSAPNLPDDGAVLRPPVGKLLVQSVDHLTACLDDPFTFGQIAAAHALSGLHAVGATPWTALATASAAGEADLAALLEGASGVLHADGCTLAGVSRAEAAHIALGFAVTGLVDAGKVLRQSGLRPGDRLILTKPLGTGVILAAHARGQARAPWLLAAIGSMRGSNATAARIALAHRPSAGTAVSALGLAGHLEAMLRASGVAAVLRLAAIPLLPGAQALADDGIESTMASDNRRVVAGLNATSTALLVDPQTSGGLLAGIPPEHADSCLRRMLDNGLDAAIIGAIEPPRTDAASIRLE